MKGAGGVRLVARGLRRRAPSSVATWAVAVVVIAGAVLGAVFARAASESDLQDVLRSAPAQTRIAMQVQVGGFQQLAPAQAQAAIAEAGNSPASRFYPRRVRSLFWQAGKLTRMVWSDGICGSVQFVSGRCPSGAGETMVSTRSASAVAGWHLGAHVLLADGQGGLITVRVVGVYTPIDTSAPIWAGHDYLQQFDTPAGLVTDTVFASQSTFDRFPTPVQVRAEIDLLLDEQSVRLADRASVRAFAFRVDEWASAHRHVAAVSTGMSAVLRRAAGQEASILASTTLVVLQLCVLGWLVLFQVLRDAFDGRADDIVLAKLRGYGVVALLRFACAEPALLLLLALGVGIPTGWAIADAITQAVLLPGTPVILTPSALLAAAAALGGGAVAVVVSSSGVLRRPVVEQWRSTRTRVVMRQRGGFVEIALVVLALVGFTALRLVGPDRAGPAVLLAPGLLVIAVGIGAARLLPLLLRPAVAATAFRRRLALQLAVRQVIRRPAGLRLVALLTVAVGLATFGVGGEAVAIVNRLDRAGVEAGAEAVQRIQVAPGEDPERLVERADPHGRWAAATATWITFGGTDVKGYVLAVPADRLPAVLNEVPGIQTASSLRGGLVGAVPPLMVRGRRLGVTIAIPAVPSGAMEVRLELRSASGAPIDISAGLLRPGRRDYRAAVPCSDGCSLAEIELARTPLAEGVISGLAMVSALTVDGRPLHTDLAEEGAWKAAVPLGSATDSVHVVAGTLVDRFRSDDGGTGGLAHQDLPDPVPAIVTAGTVRTTATGARLKVESSSDATADLVVVRRAAALPVITDQGVMVDLQTFDAALPTFAVDAQWSVWLGPGAPQDARARLQRAGLVLDGQPARLPAREEALARQGPALALLLLVVMSVAGALCAIGGVTVSIGASLRRRSFEAAALIAVGVTRAQVYRAAFTEQLLLLGSAVVLGIPAGLITVALALPALPQANTPTPTPQIALPPAWPVAALAVVFAAAVVAAVGWSAHRVVRAARASRLREGEG